MIRDSNRWTSNNYFPNVLFVNVSKSDEPFFHSFPVDCIILRKPDEIVTHAYGKIAQSDLSGEPERARGALRIIFWVIHLFRWYGRVYRGRDLKKGYTVIKLFLFLFFVQRVVFFFLFKYDFCTSRRHARGFRFAIVNRKIRDRQWIVRVRTLSANNHKRLLINQLYTCN